MRTCVFCTKKVYKDQEFTAELRMEYAEDVIWSVWTFAHTSCRVNNVLRFEKIVLDMIQEIGDGIMRHK